MLAYQYIHIIAKAVASFSPQLNYAPAWSKYADGVTLMAQASFQKISTFGRLALCVPGNVKVLWQP